MRPRANRVAPLLIVLLIAASIAVSVPPTRASPVQLTGRYLMAFLACDTSTTDCANPQNHMTYLFESNDSTSYSAVPGFQPYHGSVPDPVRRGNTVYIYNPGTLVRFHLDTGVEDPPKAVALSFSNGTSGIFVDPSLFLDSGGTLHLFYLPGIVGQDPASCPTGQSTCTKHIMSATEVAGSDGGSFVVDSGTRADYTIIQCCFSDPAVFQGPSGYYLYVSDGQSVVAFDSSSLSGSYAPVQGLANGVLVPQGEGGVPAGYYDSPSQMFWTFVTRGAKVASIARASTPGVTSPVGNSSFATILSGCNVRGLGCSFTVESPGFHLNYAGVTSATSTTSSASASSSASSTSSSTTATHTLQSTSSSTSSTTTSSAPNPTTSVSTQSTTATAPATTSSSTASSTSPVASAVTTSTSTSSVTTVLSSTSASSTSTQTTASAGVAAFPYQSAVLAGFTVLILVSYLVTRGRVGRRTPLEGSALSRGLPSVSDAAMQRPRRSGR